MERNEGKTEEIKIDVKDFCFVMIKPDGVERRLVGKIFQRLEEKGKRLNRLFLLIKQVSNLQEFLLALLPKTEPKPSISTRKRVQALGKIVNSSAVDQ
jgi:nucleoside diphosphate kinase